jgi:hypothetical protein
MDCIVLSPYPNRNKECECSFPDGNCVSQLHPSSNCISMVRKKSHHQMGYLLSREYQCLPPSIPQNNHSKDKKELFPIPVLHIFLLSMELL